jgi:flagellar biosynthetic protein FlhB
VTESAEHESRTEEATEKKINDAIEKGNVPVSREIGVVAIFLGFLLAADFLMDAAGGRFTGSLAAMLASVAEFSFRSGADAQLYLIAISFEAARFLTPLLSIFIFAGLAASFAQGPPRVILNRITPKLSRISVFEGSKRIIGAPAAIEFLRALLKIVTAAAVVAFSLYADRSLILEAMRADARLMPGTAISLVARLTAALCVPLTAFAVADLLWVRMKWRRDLRMSRQEVKDEIKQAEGDPIVKARLRSLALDRSRKRMIAAVPRATFVITNPTHFAIALRYSREEGGAPLVVAKGKDLIALRIREVAERHDIPIVERKALVRAMFDHVDVDQMIPSDFYRPVAELIHFLNSTGAAQERR